MIGGIGLMEIKGSEMSELEEFKKVVSPIAYRLAYKSKLGTTEYQQLYAEEDVIKYFSNKPQPTIPKSIAEKTVGYFDKDRPNYFERSTRFVFSNWSSDLNGDNFDDSEFNKRIQIVGAYLNPLTRDLVKVEDVAE